jgi:hypothetical protein
VALPPAAEIYDPLIHRLRQDSCRDGEICVAREKAASPWSCATPCKTSKTLVDLGYSNGACVPTFVVYDTNGMSGVSVFTPQPNAPSGYVADQLCYPCADPLSGGAPSGACY